MTTATEAKLLEFPTNTMVDTSNPTEFESDPNLIPSGYSNATFDATTGLISIPVHSGVGTIGFGSYVPQNYSGPGAIYLYAVIIRDSLGNVLVNEEFNSWSGTLPPLSNGEATAVFTGDSGREWSVYSNATSIFTSYGAEFAQRTANGDKGIVYPADGAGPFSVLMSTDLAIASGVTELTVDLRWGYQIMNMGPDPRTFALGFQNTDISTKDLFAFLSAGPDTTRPSLEITSDVATLSTGETATVTFTFDEDPGASFTWDGSAGDVVVTGGTLSAISGTGMVRTATFTPTAGANNGTASITVADGSYADAAGNLGIAAATPQLTFDTLAPAAPAAPALAVASDSGLAGDGVTTSRTPLIEGSGAEANAVIHLYDGSTEIGSVQANAQGAWSISTSLAVGRHTLTATQTDEAGNVSPAGAAFALRITAPTPPAPPPPLVDGVPVAENPVTLPGNVPGSAVDVPVVTSERSESDGAAGLADIPLASNNGQTLLGAQLPVGYGLSTSGASVPLSGGQDLLISSIKASTPDHAPGDQNHLVQNGLTFLNGLNFTTLLVNTVKPVGTAGAAGTMVLTGMNPSGDHGTALVVETKDMAPGSKLEIVNVDFAALVGSADVTARGKGMILTGDNASQHFTVGTNGQNHVFAGGGEDQLSFGLPSSSSRSGAPGTATASTSTLHGGQADDTAVFAGARADFDISVHNGYLTVASKSAPDAKALVVNVEQLKFSDGVVAVEDSAALDTLAGIYQNVLGRQADLKGFEFWADAHDAGASWGTILLNMAASSEGLAGGKGFNGDAGHDIGTLYQALFNRAADAEGLAFWHAAMEDGLTLEQVATSLVQSAEMIGHQRAAIDWDFQL